jgi:hypothetical protein
MNHNNPYLIAETVELEGYFTRIESASENLRGPIVE